MPEDNLLGPRGDGFSIAQARLGPGRIHHCMRAIGSAERAFELMCERAHSREAFGGKLAEKQFVQDFIAKSRMEIDAARLMVLHAAWKMDTEGKRAARQEISMIKVVAAQMHQDVCDRAMQVHGALGMSDDTPLALMWRQGRWLRIADGPDEVHKMVIALRELNRFKPRESRGGDSAARPRRRGQAADAPHARGPSTGLTDEQHDFVAAIRDFAERESYDSSRGRPPLRRGRGQDGRARLVRAADRRGVRRLGRQLPRRLPVPRGDGPRAGADRRLRRDAHLRRARSTASAPRSRSGTCSAG